MRLKRLEIKKLYGTFTKTVSFDERLNLLVGINGSGKTSILNCIDWLLKPDLPRLAATKFASLKLVLDHEGRELLIHARHEPGEPGRMVVTEDNAVFSTHGISVDLVRSHESIKNERDLSEVCQHYKSLQPEPSERKLWRSLHTLPKPLSILLDRTISAEVEEQVFYDDAGRMRLHKKTKSPIDKVIEVTRARYAAYRERVNSLNDILKARIVSSAFNSPFEVSRVAKDSEVSLEEIARLEGKVTTLISSMDPTSSAFKNVQSYFRDAKQLASHAKKDKNLQTIFSAQFRQISELAVAFNEYERKASSSFESLGSYLAALNSFFRESGKQMGFNDHDGQPGFQFLNATGAAIGAFLDVDRLSSGEKQILILITFLAFASKKDQIFVVDEPELSLHPRWQKNFLDAVISQAPASMQIILATHSPEIVAKYRSKCIILDV